MWTGASVAHRFGLSSASTGGKLPHMTGYCDRLTESEFPTLYQFVSNVGCNHTCKRIEDANVERVLLTGDKYDVAGG